jgi:hypothetical protein
MPDRQMEARCTRITRRPTLRRLSLPARHQAGRAAGIVPSSAVSVRRNPGVVGTGAIPRVFMR